ncbi:MAG: polysaccharide pyruvyl transferase family protein [Lachnospiraceae bacterium]|jgi:hypothetical protein|nr:polysaccharide pyruvyl transferase family protein [Lachnospiraceae bacterium]
MAAGIITMFHNSSNYGGILQAYALTKVLINHGIEAEQIRYDNFSAFSFSRRLKNKVRKYEAVIKHPEQIKYQRKIRKRVRAVVKASNQLVPHSRKVFKEKNIQKCLTDYSIFITGSDQVWHGEWPAYFLPFVPDGTKKIAYAVSTGKSYLSLSDMEKIKEYVKEYTAISVREADTAAILQKAMPEKIIEFVLDPSLLLDLEDWDAVTSERKVDAPYAFCYFLGSDERPRKVAEKYAEKYKLVLVTIPHMQGKIEKNDIDFGDIQVYDATPQDFLAYIKYAELIFTDSFHATIFSSVFRKQYVVFGRTEHKEMNNRIETLTDIFHTAHRFIDNAGGFSIDYIEKMKKIDYSNDGSSSGGITVSYKTESFERMKEHSIDFLIGSINK